MKKFRDILSETIQKQGSEYTIQSKKGKHLENMIPSLLL
jgi:hypothetical protein